MVLIALYSNEKYAKTGNGTIVISTKLEDGETISDCKKRYRENQRKANELYKTNNNIERKPRSSIGFKKDNNNMLPLEEICVKNCSKEINFIKMDNDDNSGNSIVLIGSSKSGKSTAMMHIYNRYFNKKKYVSTLFSINSHIPIYKTSGDLIKVNKFVNQSERLIKDMKKINMDSSPPNKWRFCILLDDIVDARYSRVLNALLLTYRNANFSSLVSIQYPKLLSKSARCSANNLLFFSQNLQEGIETVLRSFLGAEFAKMGVTKFNEQIDLYRELTQDHAFLYYHPMSRTLKRIRLKI